MSKPTKSRGELEALIMAEIRKFPECNNVVSVAITRPTDSTWDAAFVAEGNVAVCAKAFEIARVLSSRWDLA